jgi:hypothetical protein
MSLVRQILLDRGSGLANDLDNNFRLGEHGDVAAVGLDRGRVYTFRQKTLQIRMHRLVVPGENVPARLQLPGNPVEILQFIRVHRSAIINIDSIVRLEPASHGEFDVIVKHGGQTRVSRTYRFALEQRLGQPL